MECCNVEHGPPQERPQLHTRLAQFPHTAPPRLSAGPPRLSAGSSSVHESIESKASFAAPLSEIKSSSRQDKESSETFVAMLRSILEEQTSLRGMIHQQHQTLSQRLDDISSLITGTKAMQHWQQSPSSEVSSKFTATGLAAILEKKRPSKTSHRSNSSNLTKEVPTKKRNIFARAILSNQFEIAMCFVILANCLMMLLSLQMKGLHEGYKMGLRRNDAGWEFHEPRFHFMENTFNGIYLLELIAKIVVNGREFPKQPSNVMDFVVVFFSCLDSFVFQPMAIEAVNVSVLRLIRLSRIFRVAKFMRFSEHLTELRVLLRTLYLAVRGILWSIVLLGGIIVGGGILITQLALNYIDDETLSMTTRVFLYQNFGTAFSSIFTIFESTFSSGWRTYARPLIEDVSYIFAVFWVFWVIMVNFMTMRVVGALFLKQTMAVAAHDDEKVAMDQMKNRQTLAENLRVIFEAADTSGDGAINLEEFNRMMRRRTVVEQFATLGLEADELHALFSVLSSDDGQADYNEFLNGALQLNTSSPTLDSLKSLQNQLKIGADLRLLVDLFCPDKDQ